jgi:hypothetical protein
MENLEVNHRSWFLSAGPWASREHASPLCLVTRRTLPRATSNLHESAVYYNCKLNQINMQRPCNISRVKQV